MNLALHLARVRSSEVLGVIFIEAQRVPEATLNEGSAVNLVTRRPNRREILDSILTCLVDLPTGHCPVHFGVEVQLTPKVDVIPDAIDLPKFPRLVLNLSADLDWTKRLRFREE